MNMLAQHVNNTTNPPIGDSGINAKPANGSIPERKADSIEWVRTVYEPLGDIPKFLGDIPEPEPQSAKPNHDQQPAEPTKPEQLAQPEYIGVATRPRVLESKTVEIQFDEAACSEVLKKRDYFDPQELKLRAVLTADYDVSIEYSHIKDALGEDSWFPKCKAETIKNASLSKVICREIGLFVKEFFRTAVLNQYSPEWAAASQSGVNEN